MKNLINHLKEKYTVTLCILITIVYLITVKSTKLLGSFKINPDSYTLQLVSDCTGIIISIIIMHLVGKEHVLDQKGKGMLKGFFVGGFLVCLCIIEIIFNLVEVSAFPKPVKLLPLSQIIIFIVAMIGVGIAEEFLFRGIVLNLLIDKFDKTPKGIYTSIAVSSIIFGVAHISNVFSGASFKSSFIQAVGAIALGALLAVIYLRTNNIWVTAILHGLIDFSALIVSGFYGTNSMVKQINEYSYPNLIGYLIYLIPIFYLLRKEKLSEIVKNSLSKT